MTTGLMQRDIHRDVGTNVPFEAYTTYMGILRYKRLILIAD